MKKILVKNWGIRFYENLDFLKNILLLNGLSLNFD